MSGVKVTALGEVKGKLTRGRLGFNALSLSLPEGGANSSLGWSSLGSSNEALLLEERDSISLEGEDKVSSGREGRVAPPLAPVMSGKVCLLGSEVITSPEWPFIVYTDIN